MSDTQSRRRVVSTAVGAGLIGFVAARSLGSAKTPTPPATEVRGGLGLTGKEWEDLWGEPDAEVEGKYWKFEYKRHGMVVKLMYLEDDQHEITFDITPVFPFPRDRNVEDVEHFFPEDAVFVTEYPRPAGPGTVMLYNSPWLADRFLAIEGDWFPAGNPGDFIAIYQETASGDVENVLIAMGNNP